MNLITWKWASIYEMAQLLSAITFSFTTETECWIPAFIFTAKSMKSRTTAHIYTTAGKKYIFIIFSIPFSILLVKEVVRLTDKSNCNCHSRNSDFLLGVTLSQRLNTFVHVHVEFLKIVNNDKHIGVLFFYYSCSNLSLNMDVSWVAD